MPRVSQELARRDFLRFGAAGVAVLVLVPSAACHGQKWSSIEDEQRTILWVETGVCTGCACSLLDSTAPPAERLISDLPLLFQETLMATCGSQAIDHLLTSAHAHAGDFLLVVDGAVPTGGARRMTTVGARVQDEEGVEGGERAAEQGEWTAEELVRKLAAQAAGVIALGTCASFGGIPGSAPNTGVYASVADVIGRTPVRIPGCPPNASWIVSALKTLLRGDSLELDDLGRPSAFFARTVHDACARRDRFLAGDFAALPGDPTRCLLKVGCKGMMAHGDCPSRLWLGRSYCIKANHPCIGCTAPGFLDPRPTVDGRDVGLEGQPATPFWKAIEVAT